MRANAPFRRPFLLASTLASLIITAGLAGAQPGEDPPTGETPPVPTAAPAIDEAKVKELVDAEVARILAEREAAAAAEAAAATAAVAATGAPAPAAPAAPLTGQNGFMDVRLNFTLTNENLFVKPGETIPSIPGWRFGRPNSLGTLFFDNYDTRFSGYETLSHAVLYKNYRKDHLEAEAGFVLRMNELSERKIDLSDAGSYLLVSWWKDPTHADPTRLTLTAFPVSADRMRLGYSYRLSWGGNEEWKGETSAKPGIKVQYDGKKYYAFLGAKSAITLDKPTAEQESKFAFLGGAGIDVTEMIRVEANGGMYNRGSNELPDVDTEDVILTGGSLQVAAHKGMPVQSSIDYKLYKNDPERIGRVFSKAKYPGGVSWLAMAELTALSQTLKDPEMTGSTTNQVGKAGDINVRAMIDRVRVRFDLQYRDLAFLLHTVPSRPAYQDFASDYETAGNYFAAIGVDKNWNDRLTLGLVVGIDKPATLTTPTALPGAPAMTGQSTAAVRLNGNSLLITILPEGESAIPAYAGKFTGQLDFGEIFSAVADVYYVYDGNTARLVRSGPEGLLQFEFAEFNQLGVNLTLQAKF